MQHNHQIAIEDRAEQYRTFVLKKLDNIFKTTTPQERASAQYRHDLTVDAQTNPYGCTGIVDPCGSGDLMSLSWAGSDVFLDAWDWRPSTVCDSKYEYLLWATGAEGAPAQLGHPGGCCDPRTGIIWETCKFEMTGFALIGRTGGTLCSYEDGLTPCEQYPQTRLDGSRVKSNREWRANMAFEAILQDLRRMMFLGDADNLNEFDGFQKLINVGVTDYQGNSCALLDSTVITWNSDCNASGGTAVWNDHTGVPQPIADGTSIIEVLERVIWVTLFKISQTRSLANQTRRLGDIFIAASSANIYCLLRCYACHNLCSCGAANLSCACMTGPESRAFLESLYGGYFGFGQITLHGIQIPFLATDWGIGNDIYVFTRKVGNKWAIYGEYQDLRKMGKQANTVSITDRGRFHNYESHDETCVRYTTDFLPRIQYPGRHLQTRIVGFTCDDLPGNYGLDPLATNFWQGGPVA